MIKLYSIFSEFLTPGLPKNYWMTMKLWKQLTLSKTSYMGDNEGYCFKFELFGRSENLRSSGFFFFLKLNF